MGVGIFSDCVFFLKVNSLPYKEKAHLKTCITANGGVISLVANDKCTHVVVISNATLNSSQQKTIQKHGIPVVKPDFIWRSIQENRLVEVALSDNRGLEENLVKIKDADDKKSHFLAKFMKHTKTDIAERDFIDDEEFEDGDEKDLPCNTEVAKYSFFQKGEKTAIVELLCFNEQCSFPFKVTTVSGIPETSQKEFTMNLLDSSEKACNKYEHQIKDLENKGFKRTNTITPEAEFLASKALQKVLLGEALNVTQLSQEVGELVESIWTETHKHLRNVLSCPLENISLNDVTKAEAVLQKARIALNKKEYPAVLMEEFYQCIPHGLSQKILTSINKKFLTEKEDLCQLIRDTININETNSSKTLPSSVGKYRALKCRIDYVDPNTEEFHQIKKEILDNNRSNEEFEIMRLFRIGRLSEAINFRSDLGNVKSLLHSSKPTNMVGILSRGLLLPKIIVEDFGLERTDIGNLGSGIYFSDSISTSVKYTKPLIIGGKRLLLVCDVALGNTKDVGERDYNITEPPEGFLSLHGVRKDVWTNSQFNDDEYVVYNVNQVKLRYIIQFCTSEDIPHLRSESAVTLLEENEQMIACELTEDDPVEDLPEAEDIKGGLQDMNGQQIPLQSIHVKARLMDLAAQVVIFQTYKNNSHFPIEAKYVFPLDSTAAVCGFEAFINRKHIIGKVKEKQQAHREYRAAVSEGHGAYLMDQDSPDVFTVSVGNLPPKATVIIKIIYVTELENSYGVFFSIPGTVASWQEDQALKENTQDTVAKVGIEGDKAAQGNFRLDMSIEMPRKIESICCYTHTIKTKKTECKAVIQVEEGSSLTEGGFHLLIQLEEGYIPRMWVETHPDQDSEACMLIFQPQFEDTYEEPKLTICLDCSNSMESCFQSAKRVALLALDSLYYNAINIITFGSTYKELYFYPKGVNDNSEIEKFIKTAKPNMGTTEFWKPLQSICLLRNSSGHHKILLISDGQLQHENLVFEILKKNRNHIKLFTCGVGAKANKHMLRCLAKDGAGAFEFFSDKSKSNWRKQMDKNNVRLRSAACTDVSIKWRLFGTNPAKPMQAPANIKSIYANENLFVYGFVPHCTQATLKALIDQKEFEHIVSTTELQKTTGTILHRLTARAFIRDYEDGILHEKEHENEMEKEMMKSFIIKLSKEHSIVTQFTSFVAVEKRSADENENIEPNILEILSTEDVDILPYMDFKDEESQSISLSEKEEDEEPSISLSYRKSIDTVEDAVEYCVDDESPTSSDRTILRSAAFPIHLSSLSQIPQAVDMLGTPETSAMTSGFTGGIFRRSESSALPSYAAQGFGSSLFDTSSAVTLPLGGSSQFPLFGQAARVASHSPTSLFGTSSAFTPSLGRSSQFNLFGQAATGASQTPAVPSNAAQGFGSSLFGTSSAVTPPLGGASPFPLFGQAARGASHSPNVPMFSFTSHALNEQPASSFGTSSAVTPSSGGSSQFGLFGQAATVASQSPVSPQYSPMSPSAIQLESYEDGGDEVHHLPSPDGTLLDSFRKEALPAMRLRAKAAFRRPFCISKSKEKRDIADPPMSFYKSRRDLVMTESIQSGQIHMEAAACIPTPPPPPVYASIQSEQIHMEATAGIPPPPPLPDFASIPGEHIKAAAWKPPSPQLFPSFVPDLPVKDFKKGAKDLEERPMSRGHRRRMIQRAYDEDESGRDVEMTESIQREHTEVAVWEPPPPPLPGSACEISHLVPELPVLRKMKKKLQVLEVPKRKRSNLADLSWSSFSPLQCQEGYWMLTSELGKLLNINVTYFCDHVLAKKGISSLGQRGKEEVLKLIATLLVLQTIRTFNLVSGITFKALMKLDQCDTASEIYPDIEKAVNWAVKTDGQYSGICSRLGLGRDWDHATCQLLGLEPPSSDLSLDLYY